MPQNGLTVGSDARFDIVTASGLLTLTGLESFSSKKLTHKTKVRLLNGKPISLQFPDGWEGAFLVARTDSMVDDYFSAQEAAQLAGANLGTGTIHQTIEEVNGSVSQYMYTDVQLILEDTGSWESISEVKQHISFVASARPKVL
jgi:hypothetical protein